MKKVFVLSIAVVFSLAFASCNIFNSSSSSARYEVLLKEGTEPQVVNSSDTSYNVGSEFYVASHYYTGSYTGNPTETKIVDFSELKLEKDSTGKEIYVAYINNSPEPAYKAVVTKKQVTKQ